MRGFAERLEQVRRTHRYDNLVAFLEAVNEATGSRFPYATVRWYHNEGREPSIAYLAAVAKAFGVDFEWLAGYHGRPMNCYACGRPLDG